MIKLLVMRFSLNKIKTVVNVVKWFYLVGAVIEIFLIAIVFLIGNGLRIDAIIGTIVSIILYFGLKNKKSWVVPTILILSSLSFVGQLIYIPAVNITFLVLKIIVSLISIFLIYFFSRKEVREYFNSKGLYLFS